MATIFFSFFIMCTPFCVGIGRFYLHACLLDLAAQEVLNGCVEALQWNDTTDKLQQITEKIKAALSEIPYNKLEIYRCPRSLELAKDLLQLKLAKEQGAEEALEGLLENETDRTKRKAGNIL